MIPWLIDDLETSQKREFSHNRMFFQKWVQRKTSYSCISQACFCKLVLDWKCYVYSAAFLLFLLSEVCVGQIEPLGILHDIFVKSKCSCLHKHCFPYTCQESTILPGLMMLPLSAMKIIWVLEALYSGFLFIIRPVGNDRLF